MLPRPTRFTVALSLAFFMGFTPLAIAWQDDDKVPANPGKKETRPAKTLGVGDPAPALTLDTFVKGKAISATTKTYVVEFWATWCPPCRTSIPHLTDLQKKFPKIPFVGVSDEKSDIVEGFVKDRGPKMAYIVATDKDKTTSGDWMRAAGQNGIPTAFVVFEGKVAFIGHPMDKNFEKTLDSIGQGKFTIEVAIKLAEKTKEIGMVRSTAIKQVQGGKVDEAVATLDTAIGKSPEDQADLATLKFQVLMFGKKEDQALEVANDLASRILTDSQALNELAFPLIDPKNGKKPSSARVKAALVLAQAADKIVGGKDGNIADTLGLALFLSGDKAQAIQVQERAVRLATKGNKEEVEARLKEFRESGKN